MIDPDSSASASKKDPRMPAQCMVTRGPTIYTARTTLGDVMVLNISELCVYTQIHSIAPRQAPCMCASGERRWRAPKYSSFRRIRQITLSQSCGTGRLSPQMFGRQNAHRGHSIAFIYPSDLDHGICGTQKTTLGLRLSCSRLRDRLAPAAGVRCTVVAPWRRVRPWAMLPRRCWIGQNGQDLRTMSAWPLPWSRPCSGLASRGAQPWPPFWR